MPAFNERSGSTARALMPAVLLPRTTGSVEDRNLISVAGSDLTVTTSNYGRISYEKDFLHLYLSGGFSTYDCLWHAYSGRRRRG